ncbi:MAG: hypothetical protein JNL83_35930 [Myxococcales bacterium]|nr:hypothetical protein [Myxococcales bacterium]
MTRDPAAALGVALAMLAALAAPAGAQVPGAPTTYIVQPGDTCLGIAISILGDRGALDAYHQVNPQLGPLPHDLAPGQIVNLPARVPAGPDAKLSRATGDVKVRAPSESTWAPAARGMELFRAWRVGAAAKASAELTFRDDSYLGMRERTIVVIYGPEKKLAKVITATATLEEGTLEARLGDLDGKPVVVKTPTSETDLRAGDVLVTTAGSGSIIANHRGKPVPVRGRVAGAKPVRVPAGMGSRVQPGKAPEPPRPLPATPAWMAPHAAWVVLGGRPARASLAWSAVASAKTYRVELRDAAGDPAQIAIVDAPARTVEVALAAGTYRATVAAIDADGFEGAASAPLPLVVAAAELVPVGGTQPTPSVDRVGAGAALAAPPGWTCAAGGEPAADRIVLAAVGSTTVRCAGPGALVAAPVTIETTAIALASGAADRGDLVVPAGQRVSFQLAVASHGVVGENLALDISPELRAIVERPTPTSFVVTIDAALASAPRGRIALRAGAAEIASRSVRIAPAAPPAAPRARGRGPWQVGAFAGFQLLDLGRAGDLGDPPTPGSALDRGGLIGLRGGWLRRRFGGEIEVAASRTGHRDVEETATLLTARAHAMFGYRESFGALALVAGAGTHSVVQANGGSLAETDPVFYWGGMFGVAPRGILCRIDLRHSLFAASGGGVAHGVELTAGVSIELPR